MKPTAISIIKTLRDAGYQAYWAGGCVRDMLLGIEPKDFDIVTDAKPYEIEDLLEHTIPVGKKFGVILAVVDNHHFEIATFRSDSGYSDGRRPDAVFFTSAEEDAQRRDFTINGMFYDPLNDKVIDYVGGQKDLENRLIRFIGDPEKRILEDHLRILRAVRFKNQFGFQYEPATYQALQKHAVLVIDKVAKERIASELNKMLMSQQVKLGSKEQLLESSGAIGALENMEDLGILKILLPELQRLKGLAQPVQYHQEGDVWDHTLRALASLLPIAPLSVRWATLFHDSGKADTFSVKERIRYDHHAQRSKEIVQDVLRRLNMPRSLIDEAGWLVEHHMMMVQLVEMPPERQKRWFLHPYFLHLMQLFKADAEGTIPTDLSLYEQILQLYRTTVAHISELPKPLLDGYKIMELTGMKPGERVGEFLEKLLDKQLTGEIKTEQEATMWLKKEWNDVQKNQK